MKRFIKELLISIVSLIITFFILDLYFTNTIKNNIFYRHKGQFALNQRNKKLDYIILGNSRAYHSVSATLIDDSLKTKGLNFGIEGMNLANTNLLLNEFFENNNQTKYVFLEISIDKLFSEKYDTYSLPELIPYIDDKDVFKAFVESYGYFKAYSLRYIPFYRYMLYNQYWKPTVILKATIKNNYSYNGFDLTGSNLIQPNKFIGKENYDFYVPNNIRTNKILDEINNLCEKYDTQLIFFTAPYLNFNIKGTQTSNVFKIFLQKYNRDFFNYSNLFKNKPEMFKDYNHVNKNGAIIITDSIINILINKRL